MKACINTFKIIFYGIILPYKIWKKSKHKIESQMDSVDLDSYLDNQYIVTNWLDLLIDCIIFLLYPIYILVSLLGGTYLGYKWGFEPIGFAVFLGTLLMAYFGALIISYFRELGGSFMLLHMNIRDIKKKMNNN